MEIVQIAVVNKKATNTTPDVHIVCGNSGYQVTFDFDADWKDHADKIARFVYYRDGAAWHQDEPFTGNTVDVPVLSNISYVLVGVYAGDLSTTTPARVVCDRSILCGDTIEAITPELKAALQAQIGNLDDLTTTEKTNLVAAINEVARRAGGEISDEQIAQAVTDYLDEHPVQAGATAEQAAQIQANKEAIEQLDTDKLNASELPQAVEEALAKAKASGEFDGPKGEDYVLTDADKAEIAEMAAELVDVPDSGGNVDLTGVVRSVNGQAPDKDGNVVIDVQSGATQEQIAQIQENTENIEAIGEVLEILMNTEGEHFCVNFTKNSDGSYSADKTRQETVNAHLSGKIVNCLVPVGIERVNLSLKSDTFGVLRFEGVYNGKNVRVKYSYADNVTPMIDDIITVEVVAFSTDNTPDSGGAVDYITMVSPDGTLWTVTVSDSGLITATKQSGGDGEPEEVVVFLADFSGASPSAEQFYTWEGRDYSGAIYDALSNIKCSDGVVKLTSVYDSEKSKWLTQVMNTGGLFESDDFTCSFKAKFCGLPGSWNNVITYGTGTHWTNKLYSDGVKWPAGGEIDAFEQSGGYAEIPTTILHTAHWGSGTESGFPNSHLASPSGHGSSKITTGEWHDFKFSLKNGVVTCWVDGEKTSEMNLSECTVSNNYLADYKPFLKPHAFYIDGSCAASSDKLDTTNVYEFEVSDFKVVQDSLVECEALDIYPQMWAKGTNLIFPVGAELYLDRVYTPANTSNKACTWESSNEDVATVVQGYVKVLSEGTATITARCGNASAQYVLTANAIANIPCAKFYVEQDALSVSEGSTAEIVNYVYPRFTTDTLQWVSSDESVATVVDGVVTAIKAGNAVITARCGGQSASLDITVAEAESPAIAYDFTDAKAEIERRYRNWADDNTTGNVLVVPNIGSLELGDTNLVIGSSSGHMTTRFVPGTDVAINPTETWMWVFDASDSILSGDFKLNNVDNANQMPTIRMKDSGIQCYYGSAYQQDISRTCKLIVIGHDDTGYYLWVDGEILKTGGSKTNIGYFQPITGLMVPFGNYVGSEEALNTRFAFIDAVKTAVYLKPRADIEKIVARDFGYVPSA